MVLASRHLITGLLVLGIFLLATVLASLHIGGGSHGIASSWHYLIGKPEARSDESLHITMITLRYPRAAAGVLGGAALGIAGAILQAMTRNPLADTGLFGINSGAALGVIIGISCGAESGLSYLIFACAGAAITCICIMLIARLGSKQNNMSPLQLILAGAALSSTFHGVIGFLLLKSQNSYDQYRYWILGSLAGISFTMIRPVIIPVGIGIALGYVLSRPLGALQLGDDHAQTLGYRPGLIRTLAVISITLLAGAAVALAGPVAFLGLLAPHLARGITGPKMGWQIIYAGLIGAAITITADTVARLLARPFETPVSMVIALVGAPMLIILVRAKSFKRLEASAC